MACTFRGDGVIVDWINTLGIPRLQGQLVVDNNLIGYAMEDIMPLEQVIWRRNKKPVLDHGAVCRCGIIDYPMHLVSEISAYQRAYYNPAIDMVTDSPGTSASLPRAAAGNTGTTTVSPVATSDATLAEMWILECVGFNQLNESLWRLAGTISGTLSDTIISGQWWYNQSRSVGFRIDHGDAMPVQGDKFTFFTTAARKRVGLFMYSYPASVTYGTILLDLCAQPYKRDLHGKVYR
jgi:hypothetical protein